MGRRGRANKITAVVAATSIYTNESGDFLELRDRIADRAVKKIKGLTSSGAATQDDVWQRQNEMMFEQIVVSWTIADMPITNQKELLARLRISSANERRWVRQTINSHLRSKQPDAEL